MCALTYHRPAGLARLLQGLEALDVPEGVELGIVVVDNDPGRSAEATVNSSMTASRHEITYVCEPARGISTARNAAVHAALARGADAVCFIDDDEWPDPSWLRGLVTSQRETDADVVTGTVVPVFDEPPPQWVIDGGFFERRRHEHHAPMRYATTSQVLIDARCFDDRPAPFDPAFGMSGGEDTHLFAELRESGRTIIWSDDAIVYEAIPASRVHARWLLRREYRRGQTLSLSLRRRGATATTVVRRLGNAALQIAQGLGRTVIGLPRGRAGWLNGVKQAVFGIGMLTGLAGRQLQEYEHVHGA